MFSIKFNNFLGAAPKTTPELLPESAAQEASNFKLYSGDMIPYRAPKRLGTVGRNGELKTIYPMRDPANPANLKWLSWLTDVDVASVTAQTDEEQRIYYTGDGVPKVTNYELAVGAAAAPYPVANGYYDLGLPLPQTVPSATVSSAPSVATFSYARDAANTATIVTSADHNFKTGAYITISGFTSTAGKTFNVNSVRVNVVNDTTFTYYNVGDPVATTTDTTGTATLAGQALARRYIYTWYTPWGEESIPSEASPTVYAREAQDVTIDNLPTAPPAGNNFIRGFRLYRTVTGTTGTDFLMLKAVWFPNNTVEASRTSNVVTLKTVSPHNLLVGDRIKVDGIAFAATPDTSFNVTDVTVQSVVDKYTFTYNASGADKATTATSAGALYWNIAEPTATTGRFYTSDEFIDDYDVGGLAIILSSENADPPDANLKGITAIHNNMLAGFVNNELCFSEIGKPWAWPQIYRKPLEYPVVAISAVAGSLFVMTTKYPYLVSGSAPENMTVAPVDAPYACTSKRGVVNIGYGVIFPTYAGLAVYSPAGSGLEVLTRLIHDWDTWASIDSSTISAAVYNGKYFASHSAGSFIFEREDKIGGHYVTVNPRFKCAFYDTRTNIFYYIGDTSGSIFQWDHPDEPLLSMSWKSRVVLGTGYTNVGAARVIADYAAPSADADIVAAYNATVPGYNLEVWNAVAQLGTVNGPVPYSFTDPTGTPQTVFGTLNSALINGDYVMTRYLRVLTGIYPVQFTLWANKQLVVSGTVSDSNIFRLPASYRSDTIEVSVAGSARIRAIHIGETPSGLREV